MNNQNSNYGGDRQDGPSPLRHAGALRPLALAAVLALSACAGLPAADPTPQLAKPDHGAFVKAPVAGQWPVNQWWSEFHEIGRAHV